MLCLSDSNGCGDQENVLCGPMLYDKAIHNLHAFSIPVNTKTIRSTCQMDGLLQEYLWPHPTVQGENVSVDNATV